MLKLLIFLFIVIISALVIYSFSSKKAIMKELPSIYDNKFDISDIDGNSLDLNQFKGKKILFVNVASKCGFTPQYSELQELHEQFGDKLTVIGLPSNQFGNQEPGTHEEIKEFCSVNFGVSFLITEKLDVKGDGQHPIYQWLTDKSKNGNKSSEVRWNFQKYLLDEEGRLIDFFYSMTKPLSSKIVDLL